MNELHEELAEREEERRSARSSLRLPDVSAYSFAPPNLKQTSAPRAELAASSPARRIRNVIFESLVSGETDIVGFVAYGMYKQSKRDLVHCLREAKQQAPE